MAADKNNQKDFNTRDFFNKKLFFTSRKVSIGSLKEIFMAKYVSNKSEPI